MNPDAARATNVPIVFIGPTLALTEARRHLEADFRPPCRRGDLDGVDGGRVVGIIDGVFHQSLAVSPREILDAIRRGVSVFGAASMGALRAAEVPAMTGVGRVYEMYRQAIIEDDDEVAVVLDPERQIPLTVPLVNVRYAVERLQQTGTIGSSTASRLIAAAKCLHYTERTYRRILSEAGLHCTADANDLHHLLCCVDLKATDARALLDHLSTLTRDQLNQPQYSAALNRSVLRTDKDTADTCFVASDIIESADAPIFIWETGDTVTFDELVRFLKLSGRFIAYAHNVMVRLLLDKNVSWMTTEAGRSKPRSTKKDFEQRCINWGWRTPEEVRISMNELGIDARTALRYLRGEYLAAEALSKIARSAATSVSSALRLELFTNDIALKRETMIYASLKMLAGESWTVDCAEQIAFATSLVCRLHGVQNWTSVEHGMETLGVTSAQLSDFVRLVARANSACAVKRQKRADVAAWCDTAGALGLSSSPKAPGEMRFALPIGQAFAHVQRLKHVVGVTRVGMIGGLGDIRSVHVSQVSRPTGEWSSTYGSGKSETAEGAIVGGIMEEIEKWAQEQFEGTPVIRTYERIRTDEDAIDPTVLDLPYDTRYAPTLPFPWHKCVDLVDGRRLWVPLAAIACPQRAGANNIYYSPRGGRPIVSTNGLASGFSPAEALVHATCEFIERDATKISELRVSNPGLRRSREWPHKIEVTSLPEKTGAIVNELQAAGYSVGIWDITSEIRVPTLYGRIHKDLVSFSGYATHPNPVVACQMALLEAWQAVLGNIAGGREDLSLHARSLGGHERPRPIRMSSQMFWEGTNEKGVSLDSLDGYVSNDIYDEFKWIRQRVLDAGLRHIIVTDLTQPALQPINVMRVIIPGLETNNPFYCGTRARQVLASDILNY